MYLYSSVENIKGGTRTSALGAGPPVWNSFEVCFLINFDSVTCIYFKCSRQTMFTICILITFHTKKRRLCVQGHKKKNPRLTQYSTAPPQFWNSWIHHRIYRCYSKLHGNHWLHACIMLKYLHISEGPKVVIVHGWQWKPYRCRCFNVTYIKWNYLRVIGKPTGLLKATMFS